MKRPNPFYQTGRLGEIHPFLNRPFWATKVVDTILRHPFIVLYLSLLILSATILAVIVYHSSAAIDSGMILSTHLEETTQESEISIEKTDEASYLSDSLKGFIVPVQGAEIPSSPNLLPGAPRSYRNGYHEGIDFYDGVSFGVPVYASKEGYVIRADKFYQEIPPSYRNRLLDTTSKIGGAPDYIKDKMRGRQVWISHGVYDGREIITIYAHLSRIELGIEEGIYVDQGQLIGYVGNSGTSNGEAITKADAHLHFELRTIHGYSNQYLGEGLSLKEKRDLLTKTLRPYHPTTDMLFAKKTGRK